MTDSLKILVRNADFRRLFLAELVMFGGDWFVMIPLLVLLPKLTGSGLWGGLVLTADTAMLALLLPYTGTVVDRLDRRKIMLVANLASIAAVTALFLVRSAGTAWVALAAVGAVAAGKAFVSPAASAALPNLVESEDLAKANALAGSVWGTMLIVGASLGGVGVAVVGPYACFAIDAVCLAAASLLLWRVRRPMQSAREVSAAPPHPARAVVEALRYIASRPRVAALVTVKAAVGLGNGVLAVFPLLATVVFGVGPVGTGLLFAARGVGALFGPLLLRPILTRRDRLLPGLAVSMAGYGLAYVAVAAAPWFALAVPLVAVAHLAGGGNWTMSNYALQAEVPDLLRGRVFATDLMIATLAISVSQLGAGAVVDRVDPRWVVLGCGLVTLVYAVGWHLVTRRPKRALAATPPR